MNTNEVRRLLRTPPPFEGESLRGFIYRASINYPEVIKVYDLLKMKRFNKSINLIFPLDTIDFDLASSVLRIDSNALKQMILAYNLSSNYNEIPYNIRFFLSQFGGALNRPKICPICFAENRIHKYIWDYALLTSCIEHTCMLIDECPECGSSIHPLKINGYCKCSFDLTKCKTQFVSSIFNKLIIDCFQNKLPNPVSHLTKLEFFYFLLIVVRWVNGLHGKMHSNSSQSIESGKLYNACEITAKIIIDWPYSLYSFLDEIRAIKNNRQMLKILNQNTAIHFKGNKSFDFVERAINEYENKLYHIKVRKSPVREYSTICGKEAAQILGINHERIINLIECGVLKQIEGFSSNQFHFEEEEVLNVIENIKKRMNINASLDKLTFRETVRVLATRGITLAELIQLLIHNKITACGTTTEVGLNQFLFDRSSILQFEKNKKLSTQDISNKLNIKSNTVLIWIQKGFIPFEKNKSGHYRISEEDYTNFISEYVSSVELTRDIRLRIKSTLKLLRILKEAGIHPVNKKESGDDMYLFIRDKKLYEHLLKNNR